MIQEVVALALVVLAALYMVRHLTGWPRRRRAAPPPAPVILGDKLRRGLAKHAVREPPEKGCHG